MSLKEKINQDLKEAMKSQDKVKLSTIRSIRALILEFEKSGIGKELSAEDEIKLLTSAAKKRKDSIEQFAKAGRTDLEEKEKQELEILQTYLPKQLSVEEITNKVKSIALEIGAATKADFGKLMSESMKNLKGLADGNEIRKIVENILG